MTVKISIHALREEGDFALMMQRRNALYFYPRPPRGGRPLSPEFHTSRVLFLSTPSARRATIARHLRPGDYRFLSTPSARRATFRAV